MIEAVGSWRLGRGARTAWRTGRRLWIETRTFLAHGPAAPRWNEVIDVDVAAIETAIPTPLDALPPRPGPEPAAVTEARLVLRRSHELARARIGSVIGDADFSRMQPQAVETLFKIRCCHDHWVRGMTWEQTGLYEIMLRKIAMAGNVSGCRTIDDLRRRYEGLDRIFDQAAKDRGLRHPRSLNASTPRDAIEVHLGPRGEPIFAGCGTHRLAIARALHLARVPAVLGFVHREGLRQLAAYRDQGEPGGLRGLSSATQ